MVTRNLPIAMAYDYAEKRSVQTITADWADECLVSYLLSIFTSTRQLTEQSWKLYHFATDIALSCDWDPMEFFSRFDITPAQIM